MKFKTDFLRNVEEKITHLCDVPIFSDESDI